jgi:glycosyltransferase involved in cell wall biosynthesis
MLCHFGQPMRVLHLPMGRHMIAMSRSLRTSGIDSHSCHFRKQSMNFKPDICLGLEKLASRERKLAREQFLARAMRQYDVFHFHFGMTFLPDFSDLPKLKQMGKKLVVQHRGSDVRMASMAKRYGNPYVRVKPGEKRDENNIIAKLRQLSAFIDHAIVADYELLTYIKPYYKHVHIVPNGVELGSFKPAYPSPLQSKPLIIHAPTNESLKGTDYVLAAIKRLRRKGIPFDFQLIHDVGHRKAIEMYRKADIVIDQLCIGSYGVFSIEAMALGKPVICYIRDDVASHYPPGLPIVNATPETLYDKLKMLCRHPSRRYQYGVQGRKYAEQNHDIRKISQLLKNIYSRL